ncbi:transmembrane protein 256-like [Saccostrea echinata]|uniref:transmembrane protein 256-like n=1 Tax=Saccostrea echinata TaxID=191078 RepID=UPI002A826FCA|nr:transmembrane protein 256-like [Saccostrea echinata]
MDDLDTWYKGVFIVGEVAKYLGYGKKGGVCRKVGGLSGAIALGFAVYGNHAFTMQDKKGKQLKKIYEKGYKMHLVHSVALAYSDTCNKPVTGYLFMIGIFLYSGSCYAYGLKGDSRFEYTTNAGVAFLIFGWLSMLFGEK